MRKEMSAIVERNPGTELSFTVCEGKGEPCRARVRSRDLESVTKAASEASARYEGVARVEVHERPTAYTGLYYVADIEVDLPDLKPAPAAAKP